jgi:hypothetical protein
MGDRALSGQRRSTQMRELVLDARDAMPEGGSLSIAIEKRRMDEAGDLHAESPGDYVMVAVRDSPARKPLGGSEQMDLRLVKGRA